MTKRILLLAITLLTALSLGVAYAGPNLKPGKWEITMETEMAGMPGMSMPPQTYVQCLTKTDLVPIDKAGSSECQVSDVREDGDSVYWKVMCSGQGGKMEGSGKITYSGTSLSGSMEMVISGAGMKIKNTFKGRRIGKCD